MSQAVKNVVIASLSRGLLGEPFVKFELEIGLRRLKEFGLNVTFAPHALKGLEYVEKHPEKRAEDLLQALRDPEIDMFLCAIGGEDSYRMLPYLFENEQLAQAVKECASGGKNKIFLGFSDTTINHFMLHKVGFKSFYGQAFLPDICELGPDMHPYTKKYFKELISTRRIEEIRPSDVWYKERTNFVPEQVGVPLEPMKNQGFQLLQGESEFSGKILGGCLESMYEIFEGDKFSDEPVLCEKYDLFPSAEDWEGRIILLETSEEKPSPQLYHKTLEILREKEVFEAVSGVIAGKPMDETHADEYSRMLVKTVGRKDLPIVFNLNVGHAMPRAVVPFGVKAHVVADSDIEKQVIRFE